VPALLPATGANDIAAGGYRLDTVYSGLVRERLAPPALRPDMFDPVCPSDLTPIRFGDKWAGMIIRCLQSGPRRFSELRVPMPAITAKVLAQSLRNLQRDGLVIRTVHVEPAGRVEYDLTPLGRSMIAPMDVACAWTAAHWDELIDAREASTA
jgi:DNA-binding HxlR family transcriptional regulator